MSCIGGGSQRSESDGETTFEEGGRRRTSKRVKKIKKNTKKSRQGRGCPKWWSKRNNYNRKCKKQPLMHDLPKCIVIPFLKMYGKKLHPTPSQTIESSRCKLIDGYPCNIESDSDIRKRKSYVMSYNKKNKNAEWVYEILNKETLIDNFKDNISFGRNEFEGTVYVQGHLAAAANHRWCQEAYHDTYLISNMVPQVKSLNNGPWKTIEHYCRNKAKNAEVRNVHVYTGPLYLKTKENTSANEEKYEHAKCSEIDWLGGKAVPTHLFKVIIVENEDGTVNSEGCVVPKLDKEDEEKDLEEVQMDKEDEEKDLEEVQMDKEDEDKKDLEEEANTIQMGKENTINFYSQLPERIDTLSGLKFIRHSTVVTDSIETIKWTGEGKTGELCSVEIKVRISSVKDESHQMFIPNRNIHLR